MSTHEVRRSTRRRVLQQGAWLGAAAAVQALGVAPALAGGRQDTGLRNDGRAAPAMRTTVLRWLDGHRLPQLRQLRPGWLPPCASLAKAECPPRLTDLVDLAPVRNWSPAQRVDVRVVGFGGQSVVGEHALDLLFPADGQSAPLPFRLAQVRGNLMQGASLSQQAWAWDGRVPVALTHGGQSSAAEWVDLPAERGVYLLVLAPATSSIDAAAWAFSPATGGGLHRHLVDLWGQAPAGLGYWVLSVDPLK